MFGFSFKIAIIAMEYYNNIWYLQDENNSLIALNHDGKSIVMSLPIDCRNQKWKIQELMNYWKIK
jgi:hypothetical protein